MNEEELVRFYGDMVYRIAFNYVKSTHDSDDVFSETFLRYFKKKRVFESEEHRRAWIIRVTINCAKEFLQKRSPDLDLQLFENQLHDPSNFHERLELQEAVWQLPADDRSLIYLFYYEDLSVKQISGLLGLNENTVKTRLARARKKLGASLDTAT